MNHEQKIKMISALKGILKIGKANTQEEICDELKKMGFNITQSTVSRTLKRIGAVKSFESDNLSYKFQPTNKRVLYSQSIKDIILDISANETTIILKTLPGSAMFVASFLDSTFPNEILGTVAGDDTILTVPKTIKEIGNIVNNLKNILANIG